ncbi:hypothetical protein D3C79_600170 [compost metagenome]
MVEVDQVIDHAKPGHLHRSRRDQEQQHVEQRHGVVFAAPGDVQDDGASTQVQPEAVREEGQQGKQEPQVAPAFEVAERDQVGGRPPRQQEDHARQKQDDDQRTKMFRHWLCAPLRRWATASIVAD